MQYVTNERGQILCECTKPSDANRGEMFLMPDVVKNENYMKRAQWKPVLRLEAFKEEKQVKKEVKVQEQAKQNTGVFGDLCAVDKEFNLVIDPLKIDEDNCIKVGTKADCERFINENKKATDEVVKELENGQEKPKKKATDPKPKKEKADKPKRSYTRKTETAK